MEIHCPECQVVLTVSGEIPKFCSQCGSSLSTVVAATQPGRGNDETAPPTPTATPAGADDKTVALAFSGSSMVEDATPIGKEVGSFRLIRHLGQGGMGTVFEAIHKDTGQSVALKLLSRALLSTEEAVQRFKRESQIAASINHPRSTFVYESGEHHGQFFITMELMTGGTLKEIVEQNGPLDVGTAVDYVLDIIEGLQVAHQAGIVHRDLKPANSFIDHDGRVKIGDFGLAKSFVADSSLTQTGTFMGTPQFAAPEQLRATEIDKRADIYALGGTLFYLLTGHAPFEGGAAQVIASIASDSPPPINSFVGGVPKQLSRVIAQTLEKDPARRPQNLNELKAALLPYAARGASLADVGRRMAAYFIDLLLAGFLAGVLANIASFFAIVILGVAQPINELRFVQTVVIATQIAFVVLYFAVSEWRWGRAIGKWFMGMRVIGEHSESPRLLEALIRAGLVPGVSFSISASSAIFIDFGTGTPPTQDQVVQMIFTLQGFAMLSWLVALLMLVPARAKNGYRGVHGILSGTRVVRIAGALEMKRVENVPLTAPVQIDQQRKFGRYHSVGQFSASECAEVLLGQDEALQRDVWIIEGANGLGQFTGDRTALNRPSRLRILTEGSDDGKKWQVTEAVRGMPLVELFGQQSCDWKSVLPVFKELIVELDQATRDDTLPSNLQVDQVWIDHAGQLKLLDVDLTSAIVTTQHDGVTGFVAGPDDERQAALRLFNQVLSRYTSDHAVPMHVIQFQDELQQVTAANSDTFAWARERLSEFADLPAGWKWDDRLGLLAVSFGLELPIFLAFSLITGLLMTYVVQQSNWLIALILAAGGLLAFGLGIALNGGPAIRFCAVQVCRAKSRRPAGRMRTGLRNMIVWTPFVSLIALGLGVLQQQLLTGNAFDHLDSNEVTQITIIYLLAMLPVCLLILIGFLVALFRPARGLPDLLVGTLLVRK